MLKVSVVSYPDAVFEKVKNNEIIFPNSMIEGEFTPEEIAEYFSASDDGTGYKRAKATDSMFEFNGIDLLAADINVPSVLRNALDVFLVHNVLQYLRPELCAGEDYFVQQSVRIADYFDASLREGGILSISTDGGVAAELSRQILACQEEKYIDLKHPEQEIKDTLARLAIKSSSSVDKTARQFIFSCNQEIRGGVSDETSRFIRILLGSDLAVLDGQVKGEMTVRLSKLQARVVIWVASTTE